MTGESEQPIDDTGTTSGGITDALGDQIREFYRQGAIRRAIAVTGQFMIQHPGATPETVQAVLRSVLEQRTGLGEEVARIFAEATTSQAVAGTDDMALTQQDASAAEPDPLHAYNAENFLATMLATHDSTTPADQPPATADDEQPE